MPVLSIYPFPASACRPRRPEVTLAVLSFVLSKAPVPDAEVGTIGFFLDVAFQLHPYCES